ncbi:BREX-1 system phosphatase PglZ type B [Agromyces sp. C10]|uniref:BREX-1 system phosphatase PglZ type B n=1 Tax=Agromyces sp. C10 TaxID=2935077 RepID=UPI002009EB05|nr:BREX-1 system phosphatase PglZ type B [Agromyces sp. C10]MCK8609318.1 BREX-1 system phosphatase PglZ type B [Agromyces sp. C10]
MMLTFAESVHQSILRARNYNPADEIPPAAILWPDPIQAWKPVVSHLRRAGAAILTLDEYSEELSRGPAIWIRSQLAAASEDDMPRIVYLPGKDRATFRALEDCPPMLRPIAEVQFRSNWWAESDNAAWTPASYIRSLGVRVLSDAATAGALSIALGELAIVPIESLIDRRLVDADYLNGLLLPDPTKALLKWMDSEGGVENTPEWKAFASTCKKDFGIDPTKDGPLTAVARLGDREDKWAQVWARFSEAPSGYPRIIERLRQARDSVLVAIHPDSWPQDNEAAEAALASKLKDTSGLGTSNEVRAEVLALEREHAIRRESIWAQLGRAPLAVAIGHLAKLAEDTDTTVTAGSVAELRDWYISRGFRADDLVLSAIAAAPEGPRRTAVAGVINAMYRGWSDSTARRWQGLLIDEGTASDTGLQLGVGECALFVDGLRFDVGRRLESVLESRGAAVELRTRLAPFPSMTASGKPAVAPLASSPHGGTNFVPELNGKPMDAAGLRSSMDWNGVIAFRDTEFGDPSGRGWTEAADLDALGHKVDLKLADHVDGEVAEIAGRVESLLAAGWTAVHVVTDHGWLLIPGGLPVVSIPVAQTIIRKSRCAQLAEHAGSVDQPVYPWTWDPAIRVAVPQGVAAFEAGKVYDHGGVSPQESITPHLIVRQGSVGATVRIEDAIWKGLRCRISGEGADPGLMIDMRLRPADASTSIVSSKPWSADGTALLVEDDSLIGSTVQLVILDESGQVIAQASTVVGG